MLDLLLLQVRFDEIAAEVDGDAVVGATFGHAVKVDIGHEVDLSTEGTVVRVQFLCGDADVVGGVFLQFL